MKKTNLVKLLICGLLAVNVFAVEVEKFPTYFVEAAVLQDKGNKEFKGINAMETVKDMTVGWNLGNTLDAPTETGWGQPMTTKAMIDGLAASGIKTIRIPVSYSRHIDMNDYTIKGDWMARVKEIVDWAIEDGMYVIINSHHDCYASPKQMPKGRGYYPNSVNYEESATYLTNIWTQVCMTFNNGYDEHLIFETMNEPRLRGTGNEWWYDARNATCRDAAETLNKLNQVCVNTIRASGGNNQKRFIMCPGLQASPDSALASAFVMPDDDEPGKLILSVHMYSPYKFAMESPGETKFTAGHKGELGMMFNKLNNTFIKKGYPVVIGEMGATNKNNLEDRVAWTEYFITKSREFGMTSCLWDNGTWKVNGTDYNEHYGFYDRRQCKWFFPEITEAMVKTANETQVKVQE